MTKRKKKTVSNSTIYIQIAAYRDPELLNTLRDCIQNAKYPENLRFGIAWQHSPYEEWDTLEEFKNDPRFHIIDIDYRDAKGPCWARYQLNQVYTGQTYILQLDSHHRFSLGWDVTLISMLEKLRTQTCPKPLLSSYLPSFNPTNDPASRLETPWIMEFDRFAPESPVHFKPHTIDDYLQRTEPLPTRFISGHFIFADGSFVTDVPYDPKYYFHGEEINLSVRAYMAGYDLFAPHRTVIWHEYTRNGKKKHWDDHNNWIDLDRLSHKHNEELLGVGNIDGSAKLQQHVRSLREYELYAGLEFSTRRVHKNTLDRLLPPISHTEEEHQAGLCNRHRVCIDVHRPIFTETDYVFWAVGIQDAEGNEIFRKDADINEINSLITSDEIDQFIHIWRDFDSDKLPIKWRVWPYSQSKGWCDRIEGTFVR